MNTAGKSTATDDHICVSCNCTICQKASFFQSTNPKIKTTRLAILILKSLNHIHPDNEYHSLKDDVLPFIASHWCLLCHLKLFQSNNWKKGLLDALNHSNLVESGKQVCKTRGYYRLKLEDKNLINEEKTELAREMYDNLQALENTIAQSIELIKLSRQLKDDNCSNVSNSNYSGCESIDPLQKKMEEKQMIADLKSQ